MPEEVRKYKDQLEGRAMLVKKAQVVPLEAIVRGYLAGMSISVVSVFLLFLTRP
jgi:phosphoribosylaminoimidazole-succinocarboxamide synthase